MQRREQAEADVAVLVVHGIGAQKPGETLNKLLYGLRRMHGEAIPANAEDGTVVALGGKRVRFHEVYWADLLRGDVTHGGFRIMELQSLSWFPWLNLRCGNYPPGRYSILKLAGWCLLLPLVNFLVLLAYYGARLVAGIVSTVLRTGTPPQGGSSLSRALRAARAGTEASAWLDALLDEYAGDVFSYVNSAGRAFHREAGEPAVPEPVARCHAAIMLRFYDRLLEAADNSASIQIVAHSLGTVVSYHALTGLHFDTLGRTDEALVRLAASKVTQLHTIGSPLEKIRFFWPMLVRAEALLGADALRWDNFVSWFDPVAGRLDSFDDWAEPVNHRLLGGGFIRGHVVYEHSPVFLREFTRSLCGGAMPFVRPLKERVRDLLILLGETLLAPALLIVVLVLGVMVLAFTASLLPYLLSLPLRVFMAPEVWAPFVDGFMYVLAGMMVLALFIAPLLRAWRVHARDWVMADSASRR